MTTSFEPEAFGKYFLVDKIATGGMAEIFKAKSFGHAGFENLVVIKRILSHLGENDDFVDMFTDEAKVSVALQHANIVRVFDFGRVFENYFIAMECVEGKDVRGLLRKLARKRRYLPVEFAVLIAHEVCRGLAYAHTKHDLRGHPFGIVHRDMSPSNILVSYEGDVKIADFGIAKAEQNTYTTADGVLKGKFEYMSPEQARGEPVDPRSDLFSLGIILHEMLTGRRLFKGESDVATLEAIKRADVKPPSRVTPRVPEALDRIVMRILSADRETRYQDASELQADLRDYLDRPVDTLRMELATFMQDVFQDDIAEEVARLEEGSAIAAAWRDQSDPSVWEGNTGTTATLTTTSQPKNNRTLLYLALAGVLLLLLAGGGGGIALLFLPGNPPPGPVEVETGRAVVTVLPSAAVYLDDTLVGEGTSVSLDDLDPGTYTVRLVAPEREPWETTVEVQSDDVVTVQHTFPPPEPTEDPPVNSSVSKPTAPRPTPSSSKTPDAGPALLRVTSTPAGAQVYIDGQVRGTTPLTWEGPTGKAPRVELRLNGFRNAAGRASSLTAGETATFDRTLEKVAVKPGTVVIGIIGSGWGEVYIDGELQDRPAPSKFTVPAGTHEIRVVNEGIGLDHRETVTVAGGGRTKVNARP